MIEGIIRPFSFGPFTGALDEEAVSLIGFTEATIKTFFGGSFLCIDTCPLHVLH